MNNKNFGTADLNSCNHLCSRIACNVSSKSLTFNSIIMRHLELMLIRKRLQWRA